MQHANWWVCNYDTCLVLSDNSWDLVDNKSIIETNRLIQKLNSIKITIYNEKPFVWHSLYTNAQTSLFKD